jgi:phosphoribosylformimino-5-aminoimidazole carboxamide ribotide isomerase
LRPENAKLEGAITGRALYDGRIDAKVALALIKSHRKSQTVA